MKKVALIILATLLVATAATATTPADPGEAGKATLAGIDSDKDGVRDDIQIWIQEKFGPNPDAAAAVTMMAKAAQQTITTSKDKASALTNAQAMSKAMGCAFMTVQIPPMSLMPEFNAVVVNTPARTEALQGYVSFVEGENIPMPEPGSNPCE